MVKLLPRGGILSCLQIVGPKDNVQSSISGYVNAGRKTRYALSSRVLTSMECFTENAKNRKATLVDLGLKLPPQISKILGIGRYFLGGDRA